MAWTHQDCFRPIDLSEQRATKIKQLKELLAESKKKLSVRKEELKNNAIDLVARSEELDKTRAKIGLLKGQLARLHEEERSLKLQLDEAKAATANVVSEYQSSEDMASLLHDEAYEEATKAFTYIAATTHLERDLAFLGEHLVDQIAEWRAGLEANQPLTDERPTRPPSPAAEPPSNSSSSSS